ncbi:MAG TPA: hypothetical protein VK939_02750 [Longimicrobiales bacterium]|nr:hypothetical protein [Longimicrobiales bacterium]
MRRNRIALLLAVLPLLATPVQAQVAWETPMLMSPSNPDGLGLYLMDVPGGDLAVMMSWRSPGLGFGLRGGIADAGDDIGVFAGLDFAGEVHRASDDFPLDVDWVAGVGAGVSDNAVLTVPLGLTFGHTFFADRAVLTPYFTPRVFLDAFLGDEVDDELDLGFSFDIGVDLQLSRSRGAPVIRFGASLGDHEGVALGIVF